MEHEQEVGWQLGKSLTQCSTELYASKLAADVCFVVGPVNHPTTEVWAHKTILTMRSPVFEAHFCRSFSEAEAKNDMKIRVTDIEVEAFNELLRYLYCDQAEINLDNVLAILYASKKYMITTLTTQCKKYLEDNLSFDNVCTVLDQSIFYEEEELTETCLNFIGPKIQEIFISASFLNLSDKALRAIAKFDYLYMDSEALLYHACLRWAEHQCNSKSVEMVRNALDGIIYHIRFPNMNPLEFAREVCRSDVLTSDEQASLYYYILTKETRDGRPVPFDNGSRVQICSRYTSLGSAHQWWSCNGPTDAFSFQTDKNIEIIGLAVYGGKEKGQHDVSVEVRKGTTDSKDSLIEVGHIQQHRVESTGCPKPIPIYFAKPIQIFAETVYTVMVTMKGPLTHYGMGGKERITCSGVSFHFLSSSRSTNGTNAKSGQIPHIVFRLRRD